MNRSPFACSFVALLLSLLMGCASFTANRHVIVSVVDFRPAQATLLETTAVLTLRFTNETPEPLQVRGSSHRLSLNGSAVGRGVTNDIVTIPPLSTATQSVTVYLENLALVRKAAEFSRAPNAIDYRLESELFAAGAPGGRTFRATATGQLDIRGLLDATTSAPASR
ncbi:MAG: LEA type 2 family protein [Opitutaceae bacterium]